jgi:hypothetical protein
MLAGALPRQELLHACLKLEVDGALDDQRIFTVLAAACRLLLLQVQSGVRPASRQRSALLSASSKQQPSLGCMQKPLAGEVALLSCALVLSWDWAHNVLSCPVNSFRQDKQGRQQQQQQQQQQHLHHCACEHVAWCSLFGSNMQAVPEQQARTVPSYVFPVDHVVYAAAGCQCVRL